MLPLAGSLSAAPAYAQADSNAIAKAEDAFGFRNGDESVGIYNANSVRGFDLQAAGNYRFNGTYFVKNSGLSGIFIETNTVRIGYNTLNTVLPGPSGVVDFKLRDPKPGDRGALTVTLDAYGQPYLDVQFRRSKQDGSASFSLGAQSVLQFADEQGGRGGADIVAAGIGRITSGATTARLIAAWYEFAIPSRFKIVANPDALPARIERGKFLNQNWAQNDGRHRTTGVLIDHDTGGDTGIGLTSFFADIENRQQYTQIFRDFEPDSTVGASQILVPRQYSSSFSTELRGYAGWRSGRWLHRLDVVGRGRMSRAQFGGSRVLDLGRTQFGDAPLQLARPTASAPGRLDTLVDQWGVGVTYRATKPGLLRLNIGALATNYRKTFSDGAISTTSIARPMLYNVGGALTITNGIELYGSFAKGLEEAGVAPSSAANPGEVLGAVIVTQRELGIRTTTLPGMTLMVAGFDTRKPYAGIDGSTGRYRFLGQVAHRGIEASLSGSPVKGLSIVAGGVLLSPKLGGADVVAGRIGSRPAAIPRFKAVFGGDYRLPWASSLSIDATMNFIGSRPVSSGLAPAGSQLLVPALATLDFGLRQGFRLAGKDLTLRVQMINLLNAYEWEVEPSETLIYSGPRRVRLSLTAKF